MYACKYILQIYEIHINIDLNGIIAPALPQDYVCIWLPWVTHITLNAEALFVLVLGNKLNALCTLEKRYPTELYVQIQPAILQVSVSHISHTT